MGAHCCPVRQHKIVLCCNLAKSLDALRGHRRSIVVELLESWGSVPWFLIFLESSEVSVFLLLKKVVVE